MCTTLLARAFSSHYGANSLLQDLINISFTVSHTNFCLLPLFKKHGLEVEHHVLINKEFMAIKSIIITWNPTIVINIFVYTDHERNMKSFVSIGLLAAIWKIFCTGANCKFWILKRKYLDASYPLAFSYSILCAMLQERDDYALELAMGDE